MVLGACVPATTIPIQPTLANEVDDGYFESSGSGEPRSSAYWLQWNTCMEGNQSAIAAANGGREAGWILLDDLLEEPGLLVGPLQVETCGKAVNLLQLKDLSDQERSNDPAYILAGQLAVAQLNLAAGSEYCQASDEAVSGAQMLLLSLEFNGMGSYLGPPRESPDLATAHTFIDQLASYNLGTLCR